MNVSEFLQPVLGRAAGILQGKIRERKPQARESKEKGTGNCERQI